MSSSDTAPSGSNSSSTSATASSSCTACGKGGETSPPDSVSPKKKLDDSSTTIEIEDFLMCTICLDFPSSPIHACDNAHVLCGRCAQKLVACPTCQSPKLSPNPLGEKLAKKANKKIDCEHFEAGCKERVLSTKFVDHLPLCLFREITCNFEGKCGVKVQFHEYSQHLEHVHLEMSRLGPKFTKAYFRDEQQPTSHENIWGQSVIKFKNVEFILNAKVSQNSQLFYSWVSVMGDRDLGKQFIAKVKFQNSESSKPVCSWRLPVVAFHDMTTSPSEAKLFEYSEQGVALAVPMVSIRNWGHVFNDLVLFEVIYEIKDA